MQRAYFIALAFALSAGANDPAMAGATGGPWLGFSLGGANTAWRDSHQSKSTSVFAAEIGYDFAVGRFIVGPTARIALQSGAWGGLQFRGGVRAGYLFTPRIMAHLGAGVVSGPRSGSLFLSSILATANPNDVLDFRASRGVGFYVSTGAEYGIDAKWSVGINYSLTSIGGRWTGVPPPIIAGPGWIPISFRLHNVGQEIAVSLRYRF